jgi:hypothetical protein
LIRPEDILLSKRITWRIDEPFTIFECDEFLKPEYFKALAAAYPWSSLRMKLADDNLRGRIDQQEHEEEFRALVGSNPVWHSFVAAICSHKFRADAAALFRRGLIDRARRGARLERWYYRLLPSFMLETKVDITAYRRGFYLGPHTDVAKKFLAILLYFNDESMSQHDASSSAVGTGFWRERTAGRAEQWYLTLTGSAVASAMDASLKGPRLDRRFRESDAPVGDLSAYETDFERFYVTSGRSNSMAGFVKSRTSWHDVDLRDFPEGLLRGAILVNVNLRSFSPRSVWRAFAGKKRGARRRRVGARGPSGRGSRRSGS